MANEKKHVIEVVSVESAGSDGPPLSPLVQEEIGRRLRAVYGKLAAEPLPEKFLKLLNKLDTSDDSDGDPEHEQ